MGGGLRARGEGRGLKGVGIVVGGLGGIIRYIGEL